MYAILKEQVAAYALQEQVVSVVRVEDYSIPSGMLESVFTAAGQLLGSNGAGSPALITGPAVEGDILRARLGQTVKMQWETVDLAQLVQTAVKTAGYTAINNDHVLVNASGVGADFEIALPATPAAGNKVRVTMVAEHATYKVTIGRNGSLVNGVTDTGSLSLIKKGDTVYFEYTGAALGWVSISPAGSDTFTTTVTAAATTTLTRFSTRIQEFSGVTTQTLVMPVVSTLVPGRTFIVINNSTGIITVNSSGGNLIASVAAGGVWTLRCVLITGTAAASWKANNTGVTPGTSGNVLKSNGSDWTSAAEAGLVAATQAEQEEGTSVVVATTPGRQRFHPSAAKAWVNFNGTGTVAINQSFNVSSITDSGTGLYIMNFTVAMSAATYATIDGIGATSGDYGADLIFHTYAVASVSIAVTNRTPSYTDFPNICVAVLGDQ